MANVIYPGNWLCLIELTNTQQYYAKCLQLVQWLEKIGQREDDNHFDSNEMLEFYIARKDTSKICNENVLLKQEKDFADKNSKKYSKITTTEQLLFGLEKESSRYKNMVQKNHFSYYFRIHLNHNDDDITELQYFILFLQMMPSIRGRVAVRLMGYAENKWNESDYFRVSHFLRFVQRKYHCFFACYDGNLDSLRPLQQDTDGTQTSFIPMLEVNGQLYQTLNKTWFLTYNLKDKCSYDKLYMEIFPEKCERDSLTQSLFKIGLRLLFKSLPGRKYASDERKQTLLKFLVELVQDVQGITPLDMLLFGALAGDRLQGGLDSAVAKGCMGEIQMLSLAISQILENIVNHSESNQGVFTFRIQSNREYLNIHYPDYSNNVEKGCLELLIADGNRIDSIVEHFLNSNKADIRLKNNSNDICLGQLLGDCRDGKLSEIWRAVRKERPEMCHGLISFANSVRKLKGAFWVRSSPEIEGKSPRDVYYFNNTKKVYEADKLVAGSYISGTQFSIVINQAEKNTISASIDEDWGFDFDKLVYATTYKDLAKALAYDENIIEMKIDEEALASAPYPLTQEQKDVTASWWKEWFNSYVIKEDIPKRAVFQCDLELLCQRLPEKSELGEPFCKGFLSSLLFVEPKEDRYYCIMFKRASAYFSRIFTATLRVIEAQGIAKWDKTCVYFVLKQYKGSNLPYCTAVMQDLLEYYEKETFEKEFPRMFPEPLFKSNGENDTWFERELLKQANTPITSKNNQGFKILETHMRLGNKVHLDEFYEMALFFENPNYAYYTAFLFLRTFLTEYSEMLYSKSHLLFYGYASYSRAVIWAIIQILYQYKKNSKNEKSQEEKIIPEIEFIIYQNDLKLDSEEPQIQMYYSQEQWQRQPYEIWNPEDTTLVSIVPISSSLTTFDKMCKELNRETGKRFVSELNYTSFWVRNKYKADEICNHTTVEDGFWETVDPVTKTISSKFIDGEIRYLTYVTSTWRDPLGCKKCFPENPIFEYPLVETDPTSTVPTQQLYLQREQKNIDEVGEVVQEQKNDERIVKLKGNMLYGHLSKGENHYQYFVKNQVYFQQERKEIASWLGELRQEAVNNGNPVITSQNCINVLIIPQKADNVEFSQYVYEYYFQGCAECVIVNTEKEFRSNFKAAYSGLFARLRVAITSQNSVKFHYVDTSLQSGSSFNRAVSLLSACVEDWKFGNGNGYEFRIEQVFLLISRLSESSKRQYVKNPEQNFHAYAELAISAMRTFGDSCVSCKLQQEAQRYYKKAATKSISSYWEKKIYARACVPFDQVEMNENEDIEMHEEGYRRMICAHRAAHYIRPIQGASVIDYFIALRSFFDEICYANLNESTQSGIYRYIDEKNRKDWLAAGLKVIARPFFAYDYKTRCAVMDMYLLLAEYWIGEGNIHNLRIQLEKEESGQKHYLLEKDNISWINTFANNIIEAIGTNEYDRLAYIRNNILKSLADIKSTYILRENTLLRLSDRICFACHQNNGSKKIVKFYQHYLRSILRMTHSSSDETKSLWLEYLLQFGKEYKEEDWLDDISVQESNGIARLVEKVPEDARGVFRNFLEVLLVENNRPIYQLVVEFHKKVKGDESYSNEVKGGEVWIQKEQEFLDEYCTRKSAKFLKFGKQNSMNGKQLHALHQLLILLNQTSHEINRYNDLGKALQQIVEAETTPQGSVVLFGENGQTDNAESSPVTKYLNLPDYFELYPQYVGEQDGQGKTEEQKRFEKIWGSIKNSEEATIFLNENGFYLLEQDNSEGKVNIIIKLENNYNAVTLSKERTHKIEIQKIEPIFIYIPCLMYRQQALGLTRKILMFRKKLIEWLETDFNNNAIAVLSRQQYLAKVLSTDKMGDHAENDFVECQELLLLAANQTEFDAEKQTGNWENAVTEEGTSANIYEVPDDATPPLSGKLSATREWFFLRSYVNSRISRLFRTMVRTDNELGRGELISVEKYYACDGQSMMMRPVSDLSTVFFTPIKIGYIRKNYLRQMMNTVTFTIQGIPDYQIDGQRKPDADIEERLKNVDSQLKDFKCINLLSEKTGERCAYLAEYLTVILLDCFISGLKAGEIWNKTKWGGEAYKVLQGKKASEKCEIRIDREYGGICGNVRYDNFVIRNKIYHPLRSEKKGFGMSQAAICWYIDSLWRECICNQIEYPRVVPDKQEKQYIIKLPILEGGE